MSAIPLQILKPSNSTIEFQRPSPDGDVEAGVKAVDPVTAESHDQMDMRRMGKLQELRRDFRYASMISYAVILGATWPYALITASLLLTNGGTAGGIWTFFGTCIGMGTAMLSMAEMASMAPTAGGQYHWVSEFAPRKYQKFLSYLVGWLCVLGWQSAMCAAAYIPASNIQGLIALNVKSYSLPGWHASFITIAILLFSGFVNIVLLRKLPIMEGAFAVVYVFGFIAMVTVLWILGPRGNASIVFTKFEDNAGWGSVPLSTLIGILGPVVTLLGSDSACHLSEELRNASKYLPRSMVITACINYTLALATIITFMFTTGDPQSILTTSTGQPYIQLFLNATQSHIGASLLTSVVIVLFLFCAINQITTTSRQLYAFARDKGLPYSEFLSRIHPGLAVPLNALVVTFVFGILASLIPIGSVAAFNIITSSSSTALVGSYAIAIGCMFRKRWYSEPLLPCRFSLGRLGIFINGAALLFLTFAFVMLFFPSGPDPTAQMMNWTVLIFVITIFLSLLYYGIKGRHVYKGPVEYVRKDA